MTVFDWLEGIPFRWKLSLRCGGIEVQKQPETLRTLPGAVCARRRCGGGDLQPGHDLGGEFEGELVKAK